MKRINQISKVLLPKLVTLLLVLFIMSGCIDEITFDTERTSGQLVVNGGIYNHSGPYKLELALTNAATALPMPVSGAEIYLVDGEGNRERYNETETGIYSAPGTIIKGIRGETYHIEITLPDGRNYQSIPETMPTLNGRPETLVKPGNLQEPSASGRMRDVPHIFISTNTILPITEETLYLKWDVESVYAFREWQHPHPLAPFAKTCYFTQATEPQTVSLLSTDQVSSNLIENKQLVIKRVESEEFYIRHVFNVILSSVTERRYNYWEQIDQLINRSGTIFDVPPATVRGNIFNTENENEIALGYFEAATKDTSHAFVTRGDLPFYIPNPCPSSGFPGCGDCLELDNSTLDRPPYF